MKRFVSVLLVAMLVVASMSVVAFAVEAEAGATSVTVPVTVNGPVGACKVQVQGTDVLTITGISGDGSTTINEAKGIVVWSNATNKDSYTFYVTVDVAADAPVGTHYLNVTVKESAKFVGVENDTEDAVADGWVMFAGTASGYVEIKAEETTEPTTEPTEEPTTEPTEEPTTEPTEEPTTEPTEEPTTKPTEKPTGEKDDVPETGDISTQVYMTGALILVQMAAAVALVSKRRNVK